MKEAIEQQLGGRAPWVQAVMVVWGDFPQARHEEESVVHVRGEEFRAWLGGLPERMDPSRCTAIVAAVREARNMLETRLTLNG